MHNKAKLKQCFAVTSAKRVAIFQACLKLVREEAGAQISKHLKDQNSYLKEGAVNKNDA